MINEILMKINETNNVSIKELIIIHNYYNIDLNSINEL
jgi:hypothetical protein